MKSSNLTGLSALLLFLTGCATTIPQAPVAFSESSLQAEPGRIGVGMTALLGGVNYLGRSTTTILAGEARSF